jgi:hypothetical protein
VVGGRGSLTLYARHAFHAVGSRVAQPKAPRREPGSAELVLNSAALGSGKRKAADLHTKSALPSFWARAARVDDSSAHIAKTAMDAPPVGQGFSDRGLFTESRTHGQFKSRIDRGYQHQVCATILRAHGMKNMPGLPSLGLTRRRACSEKSRVWWR